ncbi:START domain [Arabidopsis suecica]|uniref:START domain n=1 Tax=Arabidopsis suecica TaxID=45249 RepID=A0A8T1YIJ0_ARASU|nr:START domain [Arabidopsis suecica]
MISEDESINQTEHLAEANDLRFENALSRSDRETLTYFTMLSDFFGQQLPNVSAYSLNLMVVLACIVNEIISLATLESPLWSRSHCENIEMLNLNEYYSQFFPWYAKNVPRFVHEASRASAVIRVDASWLVRKLKNPVRWVSIFPSLVGNVSIESSNDDVKMIDMEFLTLITPVIPTRKIKVLRYCHRIGNDTWIIADISMYLSSYSDDLRPEFLRFPSGFMIQHLPNGYSKVTILEHWVYKEDAILNRLRPYLSSGIGFGAKNWLVALQRYCSKTTYVPLMDITNQLLSIVNSTGRHNLLEVSKHMVHLFCSGTCGVIGYQWRRLGAGRTFNVRVFTRESPDMIRHPCRIISASGLAKTHAKPEMLFPFIYGVKKREIFNHLRLFGNGLKQVLRITRDDSSPRNDVSLFSFRLNNYTEVFLLQEAYNEASSSMVIHSILDESSLRKIINGDDSSFSISYPCGFTIMPGQNSGDEEAGCVVSVGFQAIATEAIVANTLISNVEKTLSDTFTNFENVLAANW